MTIIYNEPARPWAFGPFVSDDIVARQAEALVQRYDLREALMAGDHARRDLTGSPIDVRLRDQIVRQLVPWVDYAPDGGGTTTNKGWPIPQGVRLEALCYSPWLDDLRSDDGCVGGKKLFALPASDVEFADQFYVRAGIQPADDREVAATFRIRPLAVGEIAMEVRASNSGPAFPMLMSHHFGAALALDNRLGAPHALLKASGFTGPAILAFKRLNELARCGMIVREVERYAHLLAPEFRAMLERANDPAFIETARSPLPHTAYSEEIAAALANDPALVELCEFIAVSTDALASWRNAIRADRGTFYEGFRAIGATYQGLLEADVATALIWFPDVRAAMLSAFPAPPESGSGSRQSSLINDHMGKWYGLSNYCNNLASALVAGYEAKRSAGRVKGGRIKKSSDEVRELDAPIASKLGKDGKNRTGTLNAIRKGSALSKLMLPATPHSGSAARPDAMLWDCPNPDAAFWTDLVSGQPQWIADFGLSKAERTALASALAEFKTLAGALFAQTSSGVMPLAGRVVADLATGVSAVTLNPAIARSMLQLLEFNAKVRAHISALSPERQMRLAIMQENFPAKIFGARVIRDIKTKSHRF
ncbi:MAG: hypothetical protein JOZ16_06520 [Methylobacteriaceae bacterium]|nr:hypothetical protein [Methylobacteriaceae bacterium]MBV9841404.1 hypothetical protein [Sphingomonadaceae bacterium]